MTNAEQHQACGGMLAAGLAITPATRWVESAETGRSSAAVPGRYSLTHVPSGLRVTPWSATCRTHVEEAAQIAVAAAVDWSAPADVLRANEQARSAFLDMVYLCGPCDYCDVGTEADR